MIRELPSIKRGLSTIVHAGRISQFIQNWELITQDAWVLQAVRGFKLPLVGNPEQQQVPQEMHFPVEQEKLVTKEVAGLVQKGAISPVKTVQGEFISQLFTVPKKDGGLRPVVNLKALNSYIKDEHFKMEGFHMIKDLVKQGDWMAKVDLKDAYFLIPIYPGHQKYLRFQWKGQTYQFHCLPFGLSCAPRVFTKVMKPVVAFLRERGVRLIIYLDDILILSDDQLKLNRQLSLIRELFQALGLVINEEKSQFQPTQEIVFLGFRISTKTMTISLPTDKIRDIVQEAKRLLEKKAVSVRDLAAFVGKTTAAKQAIRVAPLFHRHLQALINNIISHLTTEEMCKAYRRIVELSEGAREELTWWAREAVKWNSAPILPPVPDLTIETDASLAGWGATCRGARSGGLWSLEEQKMHINALELLAATLAVKSFAKGEKNINIQIKTDNRTTVAYVNHLGGTHSDVLNNLAMDLWRWAMQRNIFLVAEYLPGVKNMVADEESRTERDRCDWMVHPQIFARLQEKMGPLEVDMFASRLTHQLPRFFSWRPDPLAEATDALAQDWKGFRGYANPPWCLLLSTLAKIRKQGAQVLLIAPVWKTQPWYPLVLELLVDLPQLLPRTENLVFSPTGREFIIPAGVPQLAAWPLSGRGVDQKAFQRKLLDCSSHHGGVKRCQTMNHFSTNGVAGVRNGIEIPFEVL